VNETFSTSSNNHFLKEKMESIKCHERRSCTVFDYSLGYFKKRKCSASNFKPPEEEMKQHNKRTHIKQIRFFKEYLSSSYVKKLIFLPLILNIAFANATTTIEPSLSVLSLWTQSTTTSPSGLTSNSEILNNNSHGEYNIIILIINFY
jgi:hypothetical protein